MKHEEPNTKHETSTKYEEPNRKSAVSLKHFDLEKRTLKFAWDIRKFMKQPSSSFQFFEDIKQLIRSSGSMGANYIEANESLGKKDFLFHIKICRKEAKESRFWLQLLDTADDTSAEAERQKFLKEATELMLIFSAIMRKSQ